MNDDFFERNPEENNSSQTGSNPQSYSPYSEQGDPMQDPYHTQGYRNSYASSEWQNHRLENMVAPTNGMAITAFVFSLLGLFSCCCCPVSVPFLIIAIMLAIFSKKEYPRMCGLAKAGVVISIIGIVFTVATIVYIIAMMSTPEFWDEYNRLMQEYESLYESMYSEESGMYQVVWKMLRR